MSAPEKIAILGGGVGAMAAAFALTESGKPYDITVYQMGWRIGGKGASGRNMDPAFRYRIEEHGLHVWSGVYENAFGLMRAAYAALGRAPDAPLGTWQAAFKPQNFLVLTEVYKGEWNFWPLTIPTNNQEPGDPDASLFLPLTSYLEMALELLLDLFRNSSLTEMPATRSFGDGPAERAIAAWLNPAERASLSFGEQILLACQRVAHEMAQPSRSLDFLDQLAHVVEAGIERVEETLHSLLEGVILFLLDLFMYMLWEWVRERLDDPTTRRNWIFLNFGYGNIKGVLKDQILVKGFPVVDDKDYRAWLRRYIVQDRVDGQSLTLNSPLVWFIYDADFAYRDGDFAKPNISAAVALYTLARMAFTFKGALIWEMQAGMGDTVFTPFYEVLKQRGVKFKFFHKVTGLHLSEDKKSVAAITVSEQVALKGKEYEPLVPIKGLPCWPSTPLYEQLVDGERLKRDKVDLEAWCCEEQVQELRLEAGRDFDKVVLGISLGALPYIACELIEASPAWQGMIEKVRTTRTQAFQLWLKPTAYELGWTLMGQPIEDAHDTSPLTTWADMAHLIEREGWEAWGERYPLDIAYFCGPLSDEPPIPPSACGPVQDCTELSQEAGNERAKRTAQAYLDSDVGRLWPRSQKPGGGFDRSLLIADEAGNPTEQQRFDAQYFRGNVQPSERYVLSLSGSTPYRLQPGSSGFANLYLAGDWTWNGFNAGNVEAATMSGLLASNALSGYPPRSAIVGVDFGQKGEE